MLALFDLHRKSLQKLLFHRRFFIFALLTILLTSAVLRLLYLPSHMHWDVDESEHTLTIWNMIVNLDPISKGPPASGDSGLYHGAYYYYLYAIPLALGRGNPVSLALFTIVLSLLGTYLLAQAMKEVAGRVPALLAALTYTFSYTGLIYSRWIWNPNTIPFFMALSIFALTMLAKGRQRYLILFTFAVASISQLHVGGLLFVPIYLVMLPWLIKLVPDIKIWRWTFLAAVVPWLPTFYHEARWGFELMHALAKLLRHPSQTGLIEHFVRGFDYASFMFTVTLRLPHLFFLLMAAGGIMALVFRWRRRNDQYRIVYFYILITLLFSYLVYSFYPGVLYIHLSEHLFILYSILASFFIAALLRQKITIVAALILLVSIASYNWRLYYPDVITGDRQYGTAKQICQTLKDSGVQDASIVVNGHISPTYATYLCRVVYHLQLGQAVQYNVSTNFKDTFSYSFSPTEQARPMPDAQK